ncbi:hypothetical protein NHH03_01525 [Stieleria sp. TO1_6]|uniref:site-2 protease family protein n=1 Tax=Stieleria tagensis TaxID=2956795 RepID=UPI00209B308D|nr:site-2 protease family protein [Stieleria tagensis]MCO8120399.1 hypothetical protein [Stieleria tagensis]
MTRQRQQESHLNPLQLRRRFDLEIYPQRRRSRRVWVIKDPMSLRYFQFREEEFAILQWLDGNTTLEQLKTRFEKQFAPQRMTVSKLHAFVAGLHRNGLVLSDVPGQGEQLLLRHRRQQRSDWTSSLANPLAIRLPGIDPARFLNWLYPKLWWVFTPTMAAACIALVLIALTVMLSNLHGFGTRLAEVNGLLSPGNLICLAIALALTKVIHEIGHAIACKHYGGHCHELGVMFLVFTPCLYCNVTDAWKLPNRWHRVAISSAGILVEVVLAALCALMWWFSAPGLLNTVCLNVMLICSVGTLLLNGNPLLRYDGYYVLSDALELPNLWQDSRARLQRLLYRWVLGIEPGNSMSLGNHSGMLLVYAIASTAYRVLVLASILYLVYRICKPHGLLFLAQALAILLLVGVCSGPINVLWRMMTDPVFRRRIKPKRIVFSMGLLGALIAGCCWVPLPCRIAAPVMIEPLDARRVYVSVPGTLRESIGVGASVQPGDPLARLENIDIQRDLEKVHGQVLSQQLRLRNLESMRTQDDQVAAQLPAAKQILLDLQQRLRQLENDEAALALTAPVAGQILPPPSVQLVSQTDQELGVWSGSPLDRQNLGSLLERKTLYCMIGQPDQFEAVVYIDQADIPYVHQNQRVSLLLETAGGSVIQGTIREVARINIESVPTELGVDQQLANRVDPSGVRRPEQTSYKAYVRLDPTEVPMVIGVRGKAKIAVDWQPLRTRVQRFLARTFKPVI